MISIFFFSFPFLQPVIQSIGIEVIFELFDIELSTPGVKLTTNKHGILKKNCFSLIALVSSLMMPVRKK
jgi:hypothetical protein